MHSHLIPGIDDGAKTPEEAIRLIQRLVDMGFQKVITTPHIMSEHYQNSPAIIRAGLTNLKYELSKTEIKIEIEAAAEYFVDDFFVELLERDGELLTFSGKHILIETSTFSEPRNLFDSIFKLKTRGYQPILAHPERYLYYGKQFEQFERMKSLGCELQVNLLSLAGHYGPEQKKMGLKLLKAGMVDYLGTDLHRADHAKRLEMDMDRKTMKLLKGMTFKNADLLKTI